MRVKRFVATDIHEAMAKIKSEMGKDAVILHTRYFKEGGIFGLFRKDYVEVTAATENNHQGINDRIVTMPNQQLKREKIDWQDKHETGLPAPAAPAAPLPDKSNVLTEELADMKNIMSEMADLIENTSQMSHFPRVGQNLYLRLKRQEVDEKLAVKIVKATIQQMAVYPHVQEEQINSIFLTNIIRHMKKCKPIIPGNSRLRKPKVYALVGPTGVGKTTTIAKLAAMFAIMEQKKVAFITVDTYRIAAVEQLKTIGDIMGVPVSVVYSLNQLKESLLELSDSDMIFIDTAGRSHKNALQIEELKSCLDIAAPDDVFLVLASTCKYPDLLNIIENYEDLNISRLIFTKLDETSYYGSIYNIACRSKYPLSYFTNGQNIPDDIEVADPVKLVHLMMKE